VIEHTGSLAGVRVIDLSRMLPGPFCSMVLADHGAEVIAIEDRRFASDGLFFESLNRNKRHMCLNLKTAEGKEIFLRLVKESDVLIEGFRPGVMRRLGLDYKCLKPLNPGLIYCSITGFGQSGPYCNHAGHDVNYLGMAGILGLNGPAGAPPVIPGVQIADIGGGLQAAIGILLALLARGRTGRGQFIDISMTDGLLGFLSLSLHFSEQGTVSPRRGEELLSHRYGCYNTYATADGRYVAVGALESRFWRRLCTLLGVEELIELQYDEQRRLEVIDAMRALFSSKTVAQLGPVLRDENSCCCLVESLEDVVQNDHFRYRKMISSYLDETARRRTMTGVPVKLSDTPGSSERRKPDTFGGGTHDILREMGYDENEITALETRGVI
jgi:crotonobetainyl-CoA:carnitine CoA-transferase CaiB-like acyl-CoA transferase